MRVLPPQDLRDLASKHAGKLCIVQLGNNKDAR